MAPSTSATATALHNRNGFSVNTASVLRGIQNVSNENVAGSTNTQVAFCKKKVRGCHIHQRLVVNDP